MLRRALPCYARHMTLSTQLSVFLVGSAGGLAGEVLHWWNLRTSGKLPIYAKKLHYWIITLSMVMVSGFLTWIQFGASAEALTTFQIGIAAPIILQKLVTSAPTPEGRMSGTGRAEPSIRDFFTW